MDFDCKTLTNPWIRALRIYVPGKSIESVQREFGLKNVIKLASNENPFGPSPLALQTIKTSLDKLSLYPDAMGYSLKEKLSNFYNINPTQITLGDGSNEVFEFIFKCFCDSSSEVIISQHGFLTFWVLAQANNTKIVSIPENNYQQDLNATLAAINEKTRLIFIANPANPAGTIVTEKELSNFLMKVPQNIFVIVDEAYAEYVDHPEYPHTLGWIEKFPNLIVTRTFSKVYGLAGLRIGFAASCKDAADYMNRVRQPFNVNTLAQVAAVAALDDHEHVEKTVKNNKKGMEQWEKALDQMKLSYTPSYANFIMVDVKQDCDAAFQKMLQQGVIVRPLKPYNLPVHLRISIGLPEENAMAIEALQKIL